MATCVQPREQKHKSANWSRVSFLNKTPSYFVWVVTVCFTENLRFINLHDYGDGIRESTILLRFLKLEISTFVFVFLHMNKLVRMRSSLVADEIYHLA
jgi:hypothetical protein